MIAFRINSAYGDYYLDVPSDITVSFNATNALFDVASLPRAYTFDFTLPRTPRTDSQLRHFHRLDATEADTQFKTEMLVLGTPFDWGYLEIQEVDNGYRIHFRNNERDLLDQLDYPLRHYLTDIQLFTHGAVDEMSLDLHILFEGSIDVYYTMSVRIRGQVFTVTDVYYDAGIDNWDQKTDEMVSLINAAFPLHAAAEGRGRIRLTDFLPNEVTALSDCRIDYDFDAQVYSHHRIAIAIDTLRSNLESDIVFPFIYAPNALSENKLFLDKLAIFNNTDANGKTLTNTWVLSEKHFANTLIPMPRLRFVLNKIAEKLALKIKGDWWNNTESQKLIFFNTVTLDLFAARITPMSGGDSKDYFNRWKESFNPADHLPDITAKELLSEICEDFGIALDIKGDTLYLNQKTKQFAQPALHLTQEIVADKMRHEVGRNKGVKLRYDWGETEKNTTIPTEYTPLSIGTLQKDFVEVTQHFNTLLKKWHGGWAQMPFYFGKINERPRTLLFYRGLQTSTNGLSTIPYATPDNLGQNSEVLGEWSLDLSGTNGVYQKHLKGIVELKAARTATAIFRLTLEQLYAFRHQEYSRIFAYTPNGELYAAVKDLNFKIRSGRIEPATLNLLRL